MTDKTSLPRLTRAVGSARISISPKHTHHREQGHRLDDEASHRTRDARPGGRHVPLEPLPAGALNPASRYWDASARLPGQQRRAGELRPIRAVRRFSYQAYRWALHDRNARQTGAGQVSRLERSPTHDAAAIAELESPNPQASQEGGAPSLAWLLRALVPFRQRASH